MIKLRMPISTVGQHTRLLGVLIVCTVCVAMSGGCQQEFDNISESREARPIIGREFVSIQPLVAHGVTTDPNYRGGVTYYSIKKPPGSTGPEILERFVLPSGTRIKITKVLRCTNCWFMNDLAAEIRVTGATFSTKPARLVNLLRRDKSRGQIALDDQYFVLTNQ